MSGAAQTRFTVGSYLTIRYLREMKQNYKAGDWREAFSDTAWYAIAIAPIASPTVWGAAHPYVVGTALGIGATYVVADQLGYDTEPFTELVFDTDVRDIPKKYIEVVGPAVLGKITEVYEETEKQLLQEWESLKDYTETKKDEFIDWTMRGLPSIPYF
jgi:hypothetical protein